MSGLNGLAPGVLKQASERHAPGFSLSRYLRALDWGLLLTTFVLVGFGVAMIYSATHGDPNVEDPDRYVRSQVVGLGLGIVLLFALTLVDFSRLRRWQKVLYGFTIFLLAVTLIFGDERMGAERWLVLPFFDLQTSEPAKILTVLALAGLLAEGIELRDRFRFVVLAVLYTAVPAALIFFQPDLGTALVFVFFLLVMLVVWGIHWTHLVGLLVSSAALGIGVLRVLPTTFGVHVLEPYQVERLLVFLDPQRDPAGEGYQLIQSKIAVASGMYTGKGFMEGTQTHLNFLPAHHTDFIFAVIGEELGFLGAMFLLGLYIMLLWRILRTAGMSKSLFGTLICAGVGSIILFQVFVNIGMTIGITPITGLPLPFVSFGSSSLVIFLIAIGLVESVRVHSTTALYGGRLEGEPYGQMGT